MEEYIIRTENIKDRIIRLPKNDCVEICVSVNTIQNLEYIKIQRYLVIDENNPKLRVVVNNGDNVIGYIEEHIIIMYKFKEVWDLFIKFLFRKPKINNIKVRITKENI